MNIFPPAAVRADVDEAAKIVKGHKMAAVAVYPTTNRIATPNGSKESEGTAATKECF